MLKIAREKECYHVELFQVSRFNTLFSDLVREQLTELYQEPGTEVVFNLRGIRFIDSSGFRVLTEIAELAMATDSSFKLCNLSEDVKELIMLMELEDQFQVCSLEDTTEKILMELD